MGLGRGVEEIYSARFKRHSPWSRMSIVTRGGKKLQWRLHTFVCRQLDKDSTWPGFIYLSPKSLEPGTKTD